MNRAERRGATRKGLTASDLQYALDLEKQRAIKQSVDFYSVAIAYTLHDKLHFGEKKLQMTMRQIEDLFDSITRDYVSFDDLKTVLLEEAGIDFK